MFRLGSGIHKPAPVGEYCYVVERMVPDADNYGEENEILAVFSSLIDALKFVAHEIMSFNVEGKGDDPRKMTLVYTPFMSDLKYLKKIMLTRWRGCNSEEVKIDLRLINSAQDALSNP